MRTERGEKRSVRPTKSEWSAETLRGADGDIGAKLARGPQERESEEIGRDHGEGTGGMHTTEKAGIVPNVAVGIGILHEGADQTSRQLGRPVIIHDDDEALRLRAGSHDVDRLRMAS